MKKAEKSSATLILEIYKWLVFSTWKLSGSFFPPLCTHNFTMICFWHSFCWALDELFQPRVSYLHCWQVFCIKSLIISFSPVFFVVSFWNPHYLDDELSGYICWLKFFPSIFLFIYFLGYFLNKSWISSNSFNFQSLFIFLVTCSSCFMDRASSTLRILRFFKKFFQLLALSLISLNILFPFCFGLCL